MIDDYFKNIIGNNEDFYSRIKTGLGWFNDDCTKIIIEEYENLVDIIDTGDGLENRKSKTIEYKDKFMTVLSHNAYIKYNKSKFYNSNYPDFFKSKDFKNNQNNGGSRFGYPRFRIWYSPEFDLFRICLPLEFKYLIKDIENNSLYKQIYNNCNMSLSKNKPLIKFDDQFYKYSNYDLFKDLNYTESEIVINKYYKDMGKYILDETPEDYSWDDYAVSIYG